MSPLHRFFVNGGVDGDRASLGGDQARQIATVLRLGRGDHVVLVHDGAEIEVRIDEVTPSAVSGTVLRRARNAAEPRVRLVLALPLLRGDRSEEIVEAVTQLGVSRIVPFTSERSVVRELSDAKRVRWQRIAREAAETARRGRVPEIADLVAWPHLFETLDGPVVVAWEGEKVRPLKEGIPGKASAVSVVIGPEGGLSSEEVAFACGRGAVTVSLGPRNLRAETAATAAIAQVLVLLDP